MRALAGSDKLTPQQRKVCELLCAGMCRKRIARRLNISTSTVNSHIEHILDIMRVQDQLQLVTLILNDRINELKLQITGPCRKYHVEGKQPPRVLHPHEKVEDI